MEFNCPDCGKRLRAPDNLPNPLVRCRTCGATFRPRELEDTEEKPALKPLALAREPFASPQQQKPFAPAQQSKPRPEWASPADAPFGRTPSSPAPKSPVRRGFGVGIAILVILLLKAPRLLKLVLPPNPPQPAAPMQIDPMQMQMLRDLQQRPNVRPFQIPPIEAQAPADAVPAEPMPADPQPEADKPEADKPEADKPEADKPEVNKPEADKPEVEDNPFIQVESPQP